MHENKLKILSSVEIFKELPRQLLEKFALSVKEASFRAGREVIRKGDKGDTMYVIISGRVKVHDAEHTLVVLGEGNYFGEFSLLDNAPRSMSVTTLEDCDMLIIDCDHFFELMHSQPGVTRKIVSALTKRLRNQNDSIISELKTREAVLQRLVDERTFELKQRNEEISIKNKEITDNVNYAKKIQTAILPGEAKLREKHKDSFVLYIPKDIVSGDFYSFFFENDTSTIVAADCTGHGVTGAMLSVVGSSLLSKIINEKCISDPGKILDMLNSEIIKVLNQQSSELNDGMDVAIYAIDKKTKTLSYSGANRPLWIIRNGELITYQADKFPVGGMQIDKSAGFQTHSIPIIDGDSIYVFTDGYADQFGGPHEKKIMTKNFKEMLLSFHQLPMEEQKIKLLDYFEQWKGRREQVDDVLIVGIRMKI